MSRPSRLPLVMPSNRNGLAEELDVTFPGRLNCLYSPDGWRNPREIPYALDNGKFSVWSVGREWDASKFIDMVERACVLENKPKWIAVPDKVADGEATLRLWGKWVKRLDVYGCPLACVVQDGMTPNQVKTLERMPDVIFVGGTTRWKWNHLKSWTSNFPRVHCGRVNTYHLLWCAHRAGCESSDGTSWYRHTQKRQLIKYLDRSGRGLSQFDRKGFLY